MHPSRISFLKVFAVPVARPMTGKPLVYFHAKDEKERRPSQDVSAVGKYTEKAISWSAKTWNGFGEKKEGSWQWRLYTMGNRYMDRIDYEEWSLKSIDPVFSPRPWERRPKGGIKEQDQEKAESSAEHDADSRSVTLVYPPRILGEKDATQALKDLVHAREPLHRKAMIRSLLIIPLTFPFTIVPVVPNIPFFYMVWRAWSHWRAYKASQYLRRIVDEDHLVSEANVPFEQIYLEPPSHTGAEEDEKIALKTQPPGSIPAESILLTPTRIDKIARLFGLEKTEREELERAMKQSTIRIEKEEDK